MHYVSLNIQKRSGDEIVSPYLLVLNLHVNKNIKLDIFSVSYLVATSVDCQLPHQWIVDRCCSSYLFN